MNDEEMFDTVRSAAEGQGIFELMRVTTFSGYRENKDGETRAITIVVRDSGVDEPYRWHVTATDEDGRKAGGNGAEKLSVALSILHWYELDKKPGSI